MALAGCATSGGLPPAPQPGEIPTLSRALATDSGDVVTRVRLAEAHRRGGNAEAARLLLAPLAEEEPVAAFQLGLALEDLGRTAEARALYRDYLERGRSAELRSQVRSRLALLDRLELEAAVRSALARERELAATAPAPQTVGVFPFLAVTEDAELKPLGSALAELLTTDLAQTDRLRVLERTQVQALLREIELGESGRVDSVTAARSGRLLGAGRVVQGRVEPAASDLVVQAVVVNVPAPSGPLPAPVWEQDALVRVFELQKRLALGLYEAMGIQLTEAERERVTRHATRNVQALLAFGFGLEASDAGHHAEAARHFARAVALDPGFELARAWQERSEELGRATSVQLTTLVQLGLQELGGIPVEVDRFDAVQLLVPAAGVRNPQAEALGVEGTGTRSGTAEIIIRRPGGGS